MIPLTSVPVASLSAAQAIPFHTNGMRIGLLGGSFNPPHAAHRAISLFALKRLQLDRVWWLLTPGNPLKSNDGLHALAERAFLGEAVQEARHPPGEALGLPHAGEGAGRVGFQLFFFSCPVITE